MSLLPIDAGYARKIARTSAVLWLLVRLVLIAISGTVLLTARAGIILVLIVVALVWLDGRRLNEHLFHANLGTPSALTAAVSFATAMSIEVAATLILHAALARGAIVLPPSML